MKNCLKNPELMNFFMPENWNYWTIIITIKCKYTGKIEPEISIIMVITENYQKQTKQ
jgi:hypothetical protein